MRTFDYVVIGGGSSGCIVAARLASETDASVLLLELGERGEDNPETLIVDGYKDAFVNDRVMWPKYTTPQPGCLGKSMFVGSGRGLGGSGAINAMVYLRGGASDFDDWGVPSWRFAAIEADYAALEAVIDPRPRPPTDFAEACIAAAVDAGFRRSADLDDGDLDGVLGYERMNYRGEQRRSSYVAFLQPALDRQNLEVQTSARVQRLVLDADRRVVAVEYEQGGASVRVGVQREAVLCAGAVESAKLLMLSGVGPGPVLRRAGVEIALEQGFVGQNFQDHPNVALFYSGDREVDAKYPQLYGFARANPGSSHLKPGQPDTCYVFYPARSSLREMATRMLPTLVLPAALREHEAIHERATQLIRGAVGRTFDREFVRRFVARLYGMIVILGKPRSRGSVELGGPRAEDPARIDPAFFQDPEDLETLVRGVELARSITAAPALREWGAREVMPGRFLSSDRAIERYVRANAMTTYHYAGTCAMGTDGRGVVDEQLRVRGVDKLRIADASVIPVVPVSALNAPSMLIGYRAASAIIAGEASLSV